jgi:hypothetical protein
MGPKTAKQPTRSDEAEQPAAGNDAEWSENEEPTREQLVAGLRTFVSLASGWLDREREIRGTDKKAHKNLLKILEILERTAADQREHSMMTMATMYRDDVAAMLGGDAAPGVAGGTDYVDRRRRFPHLPSLIPGIFSTHTVRFPREPGAPPTSQREKLAFAIKSGFVTLTEYTFGQLPEHSCTEVDDTFADHLALDGLQKLMPEASPHVVTADFDDKHVLDPRPLSVATYIVGEVLGLNVDTTGEAALPTASVAKRFERALAGRHQDQPASPRTIADLGSYFGARSTATPSGRDYDKAHPRAWAASSLIADACEGGVELAEAIFDGRRDYMKASWYVWRDATRGFAERPESCPDPFAMDHSMARWRRGIAPCWPVFPRRGASLDPQGLRLREYFPDLYQTSLAAWLHRTAASVVPVHALSSNPIDSDPSPELGAAAVEAAIWTGYLHPGGNPMETADRCVASAASALGGIQNREFWATLATQAAADAMAGHRVAGWSRPQWIQEVLDAKVCALKNGEAEPNADK